MVLISDMGFALKVPGLFFVVVSLSYIYIYIYIYIMRRCTEGSKVLCLSY
jgi:hypothetical protein